MTDDPAPMPDRFVVVEQGLGVQQPELEQAPLRTLFALPQQRVAADETARFVELHREPQTRFQRRVLVGDVVAPVPVGLLDAQRIQRVVTGMDQAQSVSGSRDFIVNAGGELGRDIQFPAQFTDESDARGAHPGIAQFNLPAVRKPERLVRQVLRRQRLQQLARVGPHHGYYAHGRGHVGEHTAGAGGNMSFQPVKIAHFRGRGRDDQETVLLQARHRQVRLYPSILVQPLGVDDAAGPYVNVIGAHVVQRPRRVRSFQAVLGEGRLVEQGNVFAHRAVLRRRIFEPVLAPVAVFVPGFYARRSVPVRPLPAGSLAVAGAGGLQALVERRFAYAAGAFILAVGVVPGIEQAQALGHAFAQVFAVALERHVAAHVHFPQVRWGAPGAHPFRHHLAYPARGLQADGIQTRSNEAVIELRRLAQVVTHVGREALRAAEELLDAGRFQGRHPRHGVPQHRFEVVEITGDLVETEVLGNAVHAPGPGAGLERAHQQFAGVVLVIGAGVVIPYHRQVLVQARDGFEQRIVMLAGVQRHVHPDACGQVPGPHARAQHHVVGFHVAAFGADTGDPAGAGAD